MSELLVCNMDLRIYRTRQDHFFWCDVSHTAEVRLRWTQAEILNEFPPIKDRMADSTDQPKLAF